MILVGDVIGAHCCDACIRSAGMAPKRPADSGGSSWLCEMCGHHGIGSSVLCRVTNWLILRPIGCATEKATKL